MSSLVMFKNALWILPAAAVLCALVALLCLAIWALTLTGPREAQLAPKPNLTIAFSGLLVLQTIAFLVFGAPNDWTLSSVLCVALALSVIRLRPSPDFFLGVRNGLLASIAINAAIGLGPAQPQGQASDAYERITGLVGLDYQLSGLLGHSSGMAYQAALATILVLHTVERRWLRRTLVVALVVVLIATASRNIIAATLCAMLAKFLIDRFSRKETGTAGKGLRRSLGVAVLMVVLVLPTSLARWGSADLTGRVDLWRVLLREGSPPFGHGWLDPEMLAGLGVNWAAYSAHNGVIHLWWTLGWLGPVIGVSMIAFAYVAMVRSRPSMAGTATALWLLLMDSVFFGGGLSDNQVGQQFLVTLVTLGFLDASSATLPTRTAPQTSVDPVAAASR